MDWDTMVFNRLIATAALALAFLVLVLAATV